MRIVHVIPSLSPDRGGPPRVVASLAAAQARLAHDVTIATLHSGKGMNLLSELGCGPTVSVAIRTFSPSFLAGLVIGRDAEEFAALIADHDVVHAHGIWEMFLQRSLVLARRMARVSVITPHGMVSHYGMRKQRTKKRVALVTYARRALHSASFVQALSATEKAEIAHYAPLANLEVIANGVDLESFGGCAERAPVIDLVPQVGPDPFVLFLARLDHMKGVDLLVCAFADVHASSPRLHLIVAGPDYGALTHAQGLVERLGLQGYVHFPGMVTGEVKRALLVHADCLVQPSRHEGFSLSLLEALASGTPVVVSDQIDLPGLEPAGAGIAVSMEPAAIAAGILKMSAASANGDAIGSRGRELVRNRYSWDGIASQMIGQYQRYLAGATAGRQVKA